jgi:hypothetical protein
MTTFIAVYHIGVVITNEIDSYEFVWNEEGDIFIERISNTYKCGSFGAWAVGLDG